MKTNYLTEDEAKTKECPLITYCVNEDRVYQDREPAVMAHQRCQGSDCRIGWRWAKGSDEVGGIKRVDPEDSRPVGYCGAFGRPEV